jgi:hypothetical protein
MASPQELARQEMARRELARREAQRSQIDPPTEVSATTVRNPILNDSTVEAIGGILGSQERGQEAVGRFKGKFGRVLEKGAERAPQETLKALASGSGAYAAGASVVESGVGLAQMYTENFRRAQKRMYDSMDLPVPEAAQKQLSSVENWAKSWADNLELYKKEHPEDFLQLEGSGFADTSVELLSNPLKLAKGAMQSLPLMLEGMLPGGLAVMATASAGQHYLQNRQEGDAPEKAALRAWVTAVPEAAIEKFTLNKKINLFKNMKKFIQKGTRSVLWELGKAYLRGAGEEGSQTFNENVWRWVFSDRSTDVFQGVKQSAAMGGPLEAIFSGTAMTAGTVSKKMVSKEDKIDRVNKMRDLITGGMEDEAEIAEVNKSLDGVIVDIEAGKYDQELSDVQVEGTEYGLSPEQTTEVMNYAETRFQELDAKHKKGEFKGDEVVEWKFLKDHRGDLQALVEQSTDPGNHIDYVDPKSGKPAKHTRNQYKNMTKNMENKLADQDIANGVSPEDARAGAAAILEEAIVQVTGKKKSLRSLRGDQLRKVAEYMSDFAVEGAIHPDDWDNYVLVNGKRQKMRDIMESAGDTVEQLPKVEPAKKSGLFSRTRARLRGAKNFLVGIQNNPLYSLAQRLDGGDNNGTMSQVLDQNIQNGHRAEAGMNRRVYDKVRTALTNAGITEQDLVKMSTDLDPIRSVLRAIAERLPTTLSGTQQRHTVTLGGADFDLTWAEMLDLYLIAGQQDGMNHLIDGGLVIDGKSTGAITPSQIAQVRQMVESNDKVKSVADAFIEISNNEWRPAVNSTSQSLDGRKIAEIDNWWGLEVLTPGQVGGEKKEFNINLIENKSILHARTNGSRPLVLRDAFRRFSVFQGAVANYYGMAEPFRIARTVLNDKSLWDAYRERGMQDVFETAQDLLQHAQGMVHKKNVLESVIDFVMPNTYRALLYYNPKVWMSQYTSVFNYGSYVSKTYMKDVFGSLKDIANRELWDEMLSLSDIAYERFHTGKATLELGVAGESDAVRRNFLDKASWGNKAAWLLKAADMAALLGGWQAAKAEFKDAQAGKLEGKSNKWWAGEDVVGIEEGSPEHLDLVRRRAEFLWQRTQPSWDIYNRSMITNATKLMRSFLMFRSFHEKVLTIWNDAAGEYGASEKTMNDAANFAEKVAWPVTSYAANAMMRILIGYGIYGKREDIEDVIEKVVLAPLDAFPVLGTFLQDVLGALYKGLRDEQVYLNNENLESMPLGMLNDMGKGVQGIAHGVGKQVSGNDEEGEEAKKAMWDLLSRIAIMNGVPAYQLTAIAKRFLKDDEPGTNDDDSNVEVTYD